MTHDLPHHPYSSLAHIILVEPEDSLNIGAVARAMKNLGFSKLHLVSPVHYSQERAAITGRWAVDLLEQLQIHSSLPEALSGMQEVVGFSGRDGKNRSNLVLPEWTAKLANVPAVPTALVFGPEDTGLRNEHIEHCRWIVRIPSAAEYPSFNLAQAVILVLFELTRHQWRGITSREPAHLPEWNDFYQLDRIIDQVLSVSGFYRVGTPDPIPGLVKNMFRRISPDKREMGVLLALFARIEKTLVHLKPREGGGD